MGGADKNFFSMLLNVLKEQQPDYVAVAFDVGKTFRHQEFPDYKGTRERMPDDLRRQVTRIQEIVQALNYRPNQKPLIEALNDTLAYQSKIKAQSDLLQQAQASKNANSAVMGAGQMPSDGNPVIGGAPVPAAPPPAVITP